MCAIGLCFIIDFFDMMFMRLPCRDMYLRLVVNFFQAARVVHGAKQSVDAFIELDNEDVKVLCCFSNALHSNSFSQERLFEEFNKLSVMYRMPSDRFINLDLKPTANFETSGFFVGCDVN